ncbi:MAG: 3-phosphoshikimate 1-carboxyvinyltransferase [Thermoguttaceae bacterium]|nr:3-phosphoshikimate 1-carboxyvinyltransferase [Thermoguttaceae bacterium]
MLILPITHRLDCAVTPPGSKSITNRAFVTAALAQGTSTLTGVLASDDTQYMREALKLMGVEIEHDLQACTATVHGCGGFFPASSAELFLGNSGTSIRFLTGAAIHSDGQFVLDGVERMRQRPIGDLVDALRQWGVQIEYLQNETFPPIRVHGSKRGGKTTVAGNISSQYLSALLMAGAGLENNAEIEVVGDLVSRPYVDMTAAVMKSFGVTVEQPTESRFVIPAGQKYQSTTYAIEPDASAASYFFAAAAIVGGRIRVDGLTHAALQGDVRFVDCLEKMGCKVWEEDNATFVQNDGQLHGVTVDMHHISDTAQTLAVTALFADSPTTITNVANMRVKETDRIAAVCTELRKFGAQVEEYPDGLKVYPLPVSQYKPASIETYNDHRMAMSFSLAGLRIPGVDIQNPECTSKTFPKFFDVLATL